MLKIGVLFKPTAESGFQLFREFRVPKVLLDSLGDKVIAPAEQKAKELEKR